MTIGFIFQDNRPSFGGFVADMSIDETYALSASVTTQRVEAGSDLGDHKEVGAFELPIRIFVSSVGGDTLGLDPLRHLRAREDVEAMVRSPSLFTLTTAIGEWPGMMAVSYRWQRSPENANTFIADVLWREVRIGTTESFESFATAAADQGLAEVDLGSQGFETL